MDEEREAPPAKWSDGTTSPCPCVKCTRARLEPAAKAERDKAKNERFALAYGVRHTGVGPAFARILDMAAERERTPRPVGYFASRLAGLAWGAAEEGRAIEETVARIKMKAGLVGDGQITTDEVVRRASDIACVTGGPAIDALREVEREFDQRHADALIGEVMSILGGKVFVDGIPEPPHHRFRMGSAYMKADGSLGFGAPILQPPAKDDVLTLAVEIDGVPTGETITIKRSDIDATCVDIAVKMPKDDGQ